jgi:hypothetical protein
MCREQRTHKGILLSVGTRSVNVARLQAMATLGLAAYSSSDSESEQVDHATRSAGDAVHSTNTHDELPVDTVAPPRPSAHALSAGSFAAFESARKRTRYRRGGLPLFSKPVNADGASDSDEVHFAVVSRWRVQSSVHSIH